ncbi:AbrB/MazE/SpoVT family DNA-binding domain-containing protein [Pseudomonas sp. BF-B-25]|uniref:AbrB/MazE/SpoVT family DNA-binding domain-containing protein n=1 Tax=Pseudomonas sp. BF-B-25 TaxID=2832355 RepID=UPI001CBE35BD|nr:AbrB/MazE/SpoVT family DNA-binding domain-containing protein [Pseudomonas sp. BF-B-25]
MTFVTVSSKGRITIPAEVRATLGLKPGDRVELVEFEAGQFSIRAITYSVKCLKGMIRKPEKAMSIEEMNTAIAALGQDSSE